MSEKQRILFLCTGNSCRSQMAEGWARHLKRELLVLHKGFDDPPRLAEDAKDEEEAIGHYRRVRDEIKAFVERLPGALHRACPL